MSTRPRFVPLSLVPLLALLAGLTGAQNASHWTLVGWNDLGMHCMDSDYSIFSILPPYNTFHAQLMAPGGALPDPPPAGVTVSYEALADPDGSLNSTSIGKTNFWDWVLPLYGAAPPPDQGLAGFAMPGAANDPQPMVYHSAARWWSAEGVPITPVDDADAVNRYPLVRLVARDGLGALLAAARVVLPVSTEMDCRACHASGASPEAEPPGGWVHDADPERDYRLNALLLHDGLEAANPDYAAALAAAGYSAAGLYANVVVDGEPILCARCHASNALPGTGLPGVGALTHAVHTHHATVTDPVTGLPLDAEDNRAACYRCHPGSETKCLRGAMGRAVAPTGELAMQCQGCHGSMVRVGAASRVGWLEQPACQSCHTGTAIHNNGQIRYTTVFDTDGQPRVAVDATFATNPDVPAPGFDLYRFSYGHGGLACEACHGSTHAEFPSHEGNDNLLAEDHQGHPGTLSDCASCHDPVPATVTGGPHGLHPTGAAWAEDHGDIGGGTEGCRACHGADYRATVLSASTADQTRTTVYGTIRFWRGFRIGCWACHAGPDSEDPTPDHPALVADRAAATPAQIPVAIALAGVDPDGDPLEFRVVSQPRHGTVGWSGANATYFPETGFAGLDAFTYAAWDGWIDSNLGVVTVRVSDPACATPFCVFVDGFESGDTSAWSSATP